MANFYSSVAVGKLLPNSDQHVSIYQLTKVRKYNVGVEKDLLQGGDGGSVVYKPSRQVTKCLIFAVR